MTKLKFDNLTLQGFNSFKLVPKKKKPLNTNSPKRLTKLVKGICFKDEEGYKIRIDTSVLDSSIINDGNPDFLILEFTEESYNLKGVVSIFNRNKNEFGHYTRYIRNESQCKFFPGSKEKYVPFCPNWICSGYIVRQNGKLMFDFHDCLAPDGYETFVPDENE